MAAHSIFRHCEALPLRPAGLQPSRIGLPEHNRHSHLPRFNSAHPTFQMKERIFLPRGCYLPALKTRGETSRETIMASDSCKVPQAQDGEWHIRGSQPRSAAKTTGYIHSPSAQDITILAGGLVHGKTMALTYDCPLLATGHEYIPSPL